LLGSETWEAREHHRLELLLRETHSCATLSSQLLLLPH
jgi:hypothetical protein